jgi:hypothetical protein
MATTNLDAADLAAVEFQGLINEDVMQQIWDISKIPLPFSDMIGSDDVSNQYTSWTLDELAAPDITNAVVDGSDQTGNDSVTGTRVGNFCQESVKIVQVSTRARNVDTIGRSDELSYQVMRRQQELRRDVEAISLTGQASVADDGDSVAGKAGGFDAWLTSNTSRGASGVDGGFDGSAGVVDASTPGDKRGLTETLVRDAVEAVYNEGGDPTKMMTIPSIIRKFSEYLFDATARIATLYSDQGKSSEAATALGSVNVFVTDFGTLDLVPNRLQQTYTANDTGAVATVFVFDPTYVRHGYLTGYRTEPLAKTGLSDKRLMCVDWTLKVLTEKAHALIADIDPTEDVVT